MSNYVDHITISGTTKYIKDTSAQSMIAANEETSTTSTHTYAIGDFFRLNGVLYKVTTAIAINDTITVGTNCTTTTIKNELGVGGGVGDVRVNNTSIVSNGIANIPIATSSAPGVVRFASNANYGIWHKNSPEEDVLRIASAGGDQVKAGSSDYLPITPSRQHLAAFYGLSRAANVNLAAENVTLGTYPDSSKAAIQSMLGVSQMIAPIEADSSADTAHAIGDLFCYNGKLYKATTAIAETGTIIPDTNCVSTTIKAELDTGGSGSGVSDVQVNGTSIVSSGVANIPLATTSACGVVKINIGQGIAINSENGGELQIYKANNDQVKAGSNSLRPLVPFSQHMATFYGLTKAAGVDMASSNNAVGTYTDAAKAAIQSMLGVSNMIAPVESDSTADQSYAVDALFCYNGKLYKATSAISSGGTITPNTNCTETNLIEVLGTISHYYTGTGTPSSSLGVNGDIYLKTT